MKAEQEEDDSQLPFFMQFGGELVARQVPRYVLQSYDTTWFR